MNLFKSFFFVLLVSSTAFAQSNAFVNNASQRTVCSAQDSGCQGSTDAKGNLYVKITDGTNGNGLTNLPISSATGLTGIGSPGFQWLDQASITATGGTKTSITTASTSGVRVNDICMSRAGTAANLNAWAEVTAIVTNTSITLGHALPSAVVNADTFECFRSVPIVGNVGTGGTYRNAPYYQLDYNYQTATTSGLLGLEDAAFSNGDAMAKVATVNNRSLTTYNTTNGDMQPIGSGDYGNVLSTIFYDGAFAGGRQPVRLEDDPSASADAGMVGLTVRSDTLSGSQAANGDFEVIYADPDGRIYVNTSGTGPGNSFQSCGTATGVTSDVAMKAAVASNRMYVRAITCKNTSATVGTTLDFKDGSTVVAVGGITSVQATAPGSFTANFDPPLRGTVNTAFNFATNVAVTSATCCIAGYISIN